MDSAKKQTDEQLIKNFQGGDNTACEELLMRYKNTVLSVARRFFLVGGDTEDLVQEGMCGLYSAMISFKGESGFAPYAYACIRNRILDAVKRYGAKDYPPLELNADYNDGEEGADNSVNPEDALLYNEEKREFFTAMKKALSKLEYDAVRMYIDGATMAEISSSLCITYKQVDNALTRAKSKLKELKKN
ncbi:MAG: sigma-70 family RNA polymerase sigma factor [Candidatus Coproplasma sp.]